MRTHARKASITTLLALPLLSSTVVALPADTLASRQFKLPTCGAEKCLISASPTHESEFMGCKPADLRCLCSLSQEELSAYVKLVQPCIDGSEGDKACTEGAQFQYKDLLTTVCATNQFDNKKVEFVTRSTSSIDLSLVEQTNDI